MSNDIKEDIEYGDDFEKDDGGESGSKKLSSPKKESKVPEK